MIVMLCTAAKGGMLSVVEGYRRSGLFDECRIRLVVTHDSVHLVRRLVLAGKAMIDLLRALVFERVTGVHLHTAMRGSFWRKSLYGVVARAFGARVVYHLHGSEMKPFVDSLPGWARRLVVRLLEGADAVIVLSQSWHDYVCDLAPQARVRRIPNYVDVGALPPAPSGPGVTFLFLGALGPRKGIFDLLPAFADARAHGVAMRLVIGGDGELVQAQDLARRLGLLADVDFLGWVSGDAKRRALSHADVFVLPSYNEGLPMSVLEAMAQGLPVISTRVGGIPEAVRDGVTGLLLDAGDRPALAAALLALAGDAARRRAMGVAGHDRVRQSFSEAAVVPMIRRLYQELEMR